MKKLVISLFALVMLVGCGGSGEPKTVVCSQVSSGSSLTLDAKGDEVTKQTEIQKVPLFQVGLTKDTATPEALEELKKEAFGEYEAVEGMTTTVEADETNVIATLVMDLSVIGMDKLEELKLVEGGVLDYISLERTVEGYKSKGYICN